MPLLRSRRIRIAVLAVITLGAAFGLASNYYVHRNANPGCSTSSVCTRVLFIGNSYTAFNDLPTVFANLASSGGHRVEVGMQAPNGWTLTAHQSSPGTAKELSSKQWDLVVLQENSLVSSVESLRQTNMYPAAHDLVASIRARGARPMFFLTWAHRNGWPSQGMPDYATMQSSIDDGYLFIAGQEHAAVAPVGYAWTALVNRGSGSGLWQDDATHPATKGTYLAACVFYASIFRESPVGLNYHTDVSDADASQSQAAAASTVLGDPFKWRLP